MLKDCDVVFTSFPKKTAGTTQFEEIVLDQSFLYLHLKILSGLQLGNGNTEYMFLFCVPSVLRMQALHVAPRPGNTNNKIIFL